MKVRQVVDLYGKVGHRRSRSALDGHADLLRYAAIRPKGHDPPEVHDDVHPEQVAIKALARSSRSVAMFATMRLTAMCCLRIDFAGGAISGDFDTRNLRLPFSRVPEIESVYSISCGITPSLVFIGSS